MLRREDDGSEQPSSSDPGLSLFLRILMMMREEFQRENKLLRGEIQLIIRTFQQEMEQVQKMVKEEIQKVLPPGTRIAVPEERSLHLKFLDEVSGPVLTSKEFKGMKDGPLKVVLFDATGNPVMSGPESSAEVEIVLIDATGNDNESSTTNENFERRIIRAGDKERPHFAKTVYVKLDKGEAVLINQKLGQESVWTKTWKCRLGARFVKDFRGIKVQNAWTERFEVKDNRGELYKNLQLPFLTSEVWRLKGICRNGKPYRRLKAENIKTVQDFLFVLSVNPERLREILGACKNRWNTIVDHAKTCIINDKRLYYHKSSTESLMRVIYDSVGELKGVIIDESHFVPIDNLSADKKDHARELLSSVLEPAAVVGRYQSFFNDEASLLQQYPYKSSGDNASTNCSIQQCLNPIDPGCSSQFINRAVIDPENMDGDVPTDLGASSVDDQTIGYENADDWMHFVQSLSNTYGPLELGDMVEQRIHGWSPSPNPEYIGDIHAASLLENIKFSKIKPLQFKLGARVVGDCRTKEAKTMLFTLKGIRAKYYESCAIPSLYDEVSRLVCIRGGGNINKRLKYGNIYTVEDFPIQLLINPGGLKNIEKSQAKKWEAIVNNARACLSGQRVYFYMDLERRTGITFNNLGQVLGLHFYARTSMLSEKEKAILQKKLLASAYQNWKEVKAFDDQNSLQQNLPCLGKTVRESTSGCMKLSSTMNLFGGNENDFGSFITGGDDDIDIPCNAPSPIDLVQQSIDLNAVEAQAISESNPIKKRKADHRNI